MMNNGSAESPPTSDRLLAAAWGLLAGGLLGAIAGMFWFFLPGMLLGGICGALIGAVAPPRVGLAMLMGYIVVGFFSFFALFIRSAQQQSHAWLESPVGSGPNGVNGSFAAWPLAILCGLAAAAIVGIATAQPWQKSARRLLNWVGVTAAVLPLLLPAAGAGFLLAAEREVEAVQQADSDRREGQHRAEAQDLAREKARLRAAAQRLAMGFGELQYPGASPPVLSADGMSFTLNTNDPLTTVVAYYERLLDRKFRIRPANDGGSSQFYNDFLTLTDAREIYVYIEPPISPATNIRITLAPV